VDDESQARTRATGGEERSAVREESLLDEMRAAVRGDRQRAEQRRVREAEPEPDEKTAPADPPTAESEPESEKAGFLKRLTRRSPST
jgi:hypothetical protein